MRTGAFEVEFFFVCGDVGLSFDGDFVFGD